MSKKQYNIGDRVKFSKEAYDRGLVSQQWYKMCGTGLGTVLGYQGPFLRVRWDGYAKSSIYAYNKDFIDKSTTPNSTSNNSILTLITNIENNLNNLKKDINLLKKKLNKNNN